MYSRPGRFGVVRGVGVGLLSVEVIGLWVLVAGAFLVLCLFGE